MHRAVLLKAITWNWKNVSQEVKQVRNLKLGSSKGETEIQKGKCTSGRKVNRLSCVHRVQVKTGCMRMFGRVSKRNEESSFFCG